MHSKKHVELLIGLFFLLFTIIYISQIPAIRITRVSTVDSALYPKVMAALLLLLTLAQLYVGLKKLQQKDQAGEGQGKRKYKGALQTLILAIVYVVALEPVGFFISSFVYIFLQILVMCPPEKVRHAQFAIIAVAAAGIINGVFRFGLNLMLPLGILEMLH